MQALNYLCADVHGPRLHEGTFTNEEVFKNLSELCLDVLYKKCAGVNIVPMGQPSKNLIHRKEIYIGFGPQRTAIVDLEGFVHKEKI